MFDDPYALRLTSATWRAVCGNRFLHWLIARKLLGSLRPLHGQVIGRSRFTEDKLRDAAATGVDQYVLIGAGLDSFALRRPKWAANLTIFELDHPTTQAAKRDRLLAINGKMPADLELVAVDFEHEMVADALTRSSFDADRPAFFSWLGTIIYLTHDTIFRTLESIATLAAKKSELVFDYGIHRELIEPQHQALVAKLERFTARRGEPLVTVFDSQTLPAELGKIGWEVIENLSPADQGLRYFADRTDDLRPMPGSYFAHLRLTG